MSIALMIIGGIILLVAGGEALVQGAVALAKRMGVAPLVIGLTVVAYGTSMPEMVVSVESMMTGHPDIALGNVVGSNISNILLILGITALIFPIAMDQDLARRDAILMLMATLLLIIFSIDGVVSRPEAVVFLGIAVFHGIYTFYFTHKHPSRQLEKEMEEETNVSMPLWRSLLFICGGMALLVFGGKVTVGGCVTLAREAGISEAVIGLTILAIGSSLPELMASAVAAYRKHPGICLGNIVGSNLMNITVIMGVAPIIKPVTVAPQFMQMDFWVMIGVTFAFSVFLIGEKRMGRLEGSALVLCFCSYLFYQYMRSLV